MNATIPYVTVIEAQTYFDDRLDTDAWDSSNDTDKLKALKTATRLINNLCFIGQKLDPTQLNEFPRFGQSVIPDSVKQATCELALQLLDEVDPNLEIDNIMTASEGYANVRVNYIRDFTMPHIRAGIVSSEAWLKLQPYLIDPFQITINRR